MFERLWPHFAKTAQCNFGLIWPHFDQTWLGFGCSRLMLEPIWPHSPHMTSLWPHLDLTWPRFDHTWIRRISDIEKSMQLKTISFEFPWENACWFSASTSTGDGIFWKCVYGFVCARDRFTLAKLTTLVRMMSLDFAWPHFHLSSNNFSGSKLPTQQQNHATG